jgi:hypothetical protein
MKNLNEFDDVKGMEFLAYSYSQDTIYDKKKADNLLKMSTAWINGDLKTVEEMQKLVDNPDPSKIIMIWRLINPIKKIMGTKILHNGDNTFTLSMENVKDIYIPQDAIKLGLIEAEDTGDKAEDAHGKEVSILRMKVVKGLIDVAAPILDRFDKEVQPKRAFVTPISYRAMQTAGTIMAGERLAKRRRYGFDMQ